MNNWGGGWGGGGVDGGLGGLGEVCLFGHPKIWSRTCFFFLKAVFRGSVSPTAVAGVSKSDLFFLGRQETNDAESEHLIFRIHYPDVGQGLEGMCAVERWVGSRACLPANRLLTFQFCQFSSVLVKIPTGQPTICSRLRKHQPVDMSHTR